MGYICEEEDRCRYIVIDSSDGFVVFESLVNRVIYRGKDRDVVI